LEAYKSALKNQPFRTIYVDAFAGTGYRSITQDTEASGQLAFDKTPVYEEEKETLFQIGSAQAALNIPSPFDQYLFIEKNPKHIKELHKLQAQYPDLGNRIVIKQGEANIEIQQFCRAMKVSDRAVLFLDPYGMAVEWQTIEAIAATKRIDLWLLFPLGMGVNRMLTRSGPPEGAWASRLTTFFGTDDWKHAFYRPSSQISMLDELKIEKIDKPFEAIGGFFLERLRTVFPNGVAPNPYYLRNSKNTPLYLLCFASGNPRGSKIAIRIAKSILGKKD